MCEWKPDFDALSERVNKIETRLGKVETSVNAGFSSVIDAISNFANQFTQRMNTMDQRFIEEKVKWGDLIRKVVKAAAYTLLAGAATAMGVATWQTVAQMLR